MYCTVVTVSRSPAIGNGLTYACGGLPVQPGSLVRVPLRRSLVEGVVTAIFETLPTDIGDVKSVTAIIGDAPLLTVGAVRTAVWIAQTYCCTLRQAVGCFLPPPPWTAAFPRQSIEYRLVKTVPVRGVKQLAVLECLQGRDWTEAALITGETGASAAVFKALLERGIIETRSVSEVHAVTARSLAIPVLTPAQTEADTQVAATEKPVLLFGVTSSGKTEIYANRIAAAVRAGRQCILLVPEILLTEHSIDRFIRLLGDDAIQIVHSRLTEAQRRNAWRRIRSGAVSLVIGSRSALFAPLPKLGLIVIDEEHEWTYKNEQSPRYHARETAEALARESGASLLLGSATPSLESWSRTKTGAYTLVRLSARYEDRPYPTVTIVDLAEAKTDGIYPCTPTLVEKIQQRLERKEQSILFLNRRGIATALLCLDCRRRVVSPESQLPFTVHRNPAGQPYLLDHTSGLTTPLPDACPGCGSSRLHAVGAGTQKLEDLLKRLFPTARILRADSDTLTHPDEMRALLTTMREGKADILLGTQSVTKGLDLPLVTLAAVLVADVGLSLPHFRSGERIFQLLTQLTGRSGRAAPGEVIIQTFRPDAPEVRLASQHRTEDYLEQEWKLRQYAGYPPAVRMTRLILRDDGPQKRAESIADSLRKIDTEKHHISAAPTLFGGGREWHVLVRGADPLALVRSVPTNGAIIDVEPLECV